ncbi:AMP-binding protein [Nannocystis sp. RBIL2]|uniref:AMP-binding protein n=1 Tax=Nannocystis sp. RBIL2 TaxID=2996788 RepID=UPI00226FCFF1|nr:AMP-binding protein [Nannocystis sp. RBIL2]MCY1066614.1 AMP-binding protein [Nannocystis sp. RBIL2]
MADTHLAQMFFDRARSEGQSPGYRVRQGGAYVDVAFGEAADRVEAIASGLVKGGHAPAPGTCVTIMANTRLEWILADWALLSLGYRTVPIYVSLLPPEIGYIHADTRPSCWWSRTRRCSTRCARPSAASTSSRSTTRPTPSS